MLLKHSSKPPVELDKKEIKRETKDIIAKIGEIQRKMSAHKKYSVLIVLQGMDASGKDGIINSVFRKISPNNLSVRAFKKPTKEEFSHDFLWRVHQHIPAKGNITLFNRSHYEDILVPSVYKYVSDEIIEKRYDHINNFESLIEDNGTKILKFYLNVSKEKQVERLTERMEIKEKFWKHNDGDWKVVEDRLSFEAVYEKIFERCNIVPWHMVPADENWYKSYFVAKELLKTLEAMSLEWPELETELN